MPEELSNRERQSLVISEAGRFGLNFDDAFDFFLLNQAGKHLHRRAALNDRCG